MDRFISGLLFLHLIRFEVLGGVIQVPLEYYDNPNYSFAYNVNDQITDDLKGQQVLLNGDTVSGSYSLTEQDGIRRVVNYHADNLNGFHAIVHKEDSQIQSSTPLTYLSPAAPNLEKVQVQVQDQHPHYLYNSKQAFFSNIQKSAFRDDSQKVILPAPLGRIISKAILEKMGMLAPGYVALAGKINVPPGYSAKYV